MRRALMALSVLAAAGCGLAEYEERMKSAQERVKRREMEDKDLGPPIDVPQKAEAKRPPVALARLFLRLPRGLSSTPGKEPRVAKEVLYVYNPVKANPPGLFARAELAFGKASDTDFESNVLASLPRDPKPDPTTIKIPIQPPGRQGITISRTTFDYQALSYSVNVWKGRESNIAVIYVWNKGAQGVAAQIKLSLETFAGEEEAGQLMGEFASGGPLNHVPRFAIRH
jgi:hypothetical protein